MTNKCRRIHANITNDLKRTFTNVNEFGFSPIRQYAHDDVGSFSSMCEEALACDNDAKCKRFSDNTAFFQLAH